jgi:predicted adenylyl cyclase CyaB
MIEVEVKALVSDVDDLKSRIITLYPNVDIVDSNQLNHYFSYTEESLVKLADKLNLSFKNELLTTSKLAIRTRYDDKGGTLLIFKYNTEDADNGVVRVEKELIRGESLHELDNILLSLGLTYQSKWSRCRREYKTDKFNICVDINAGYGGLCEVEVIVDDQKDVTRATKLCRSTLTELGLTELDSELLNKMFNYYSNNYDYYYGTTRLIWDSVDFQELIK